MRTLLPSPEEIAAIVTEIEGIIWTGQTNDVMSKCFWRKWFLH
jgi:hypothetical protein